MLAFNLEDGGVTFVLPKQKKQGFLMQSVGDKIYDSDNDSVDNDTEYVTVTMTIGLIFQINLDHYNDDDDNIMALGGSQSNSDILNTVVNDNRGPAHMLSYDDDHFYLDEKRFMA